MTTTAAYLAEVLAVIDVEPPSTFRWYGRPGPSPADEVIASMSPGQVRECLHGYLTHHLYQRFYCSGAPVESPGPLRGRADPGLVEDLSAANAGQGAWQGGWALRRSVAAEVIVSRNGLTCKAGRGEWRHTTPQRSSADVQLHLPNESLSRLPGFYVAFSDAYFDSEVDNDFVRVYWNVRADGAAGLVRHVTTLLNGATVRFGFKCVNERAAYDRCDAAVLYLLREDWPSAVHAIRQVHSAVSRKLSAAIPPFTKRLAPGLALAEDPASHESFGMSRCGLLAEGLIRAAESGIIDGHARATLICKHFAEAGINPQLPYLDAGSQDCYDFVPATRGTIRSHSTAQTTDRLQAQSRTLRSTDHIGSFLEAAQEITAELCARSLWHGDRCTWVGAELASTGPPTASTLGPSIYSGSAGVALFLAQAARLGLSPRAADTALAATRHALFHADRLEAPTSLGVYTGGIGVALTSARIGAELDHPPFTDAARRLAHRCLVGRTPMRERDIMSGDAGAIVALLELGELLGEEAFANEAVTIAQELLAAGLRLGDTLSWPSAILDEKALTGFSHGAAGQVWALLELYRQTKDDRWREAAADAARYEQRWFDPDVGNWRDLRELAGSGPFMTAWCHGAPGIALSRAIAAIDLEDPRWMKDAFTGVETTRAAVRRALDSGSMDDFSLCHGLAGNGDILLEIGRRTSDSDTQQLAEQVGLFGIDAYSGSRPGWPCGTRTLNSPSLLLGLAGIGTFYLRLADPSVPTPLLPLRAHLEPTQTAHTTARRPSHGEATSSTSFPGIPRVRLAGTLTEGRLRDAVGNELAAGSFTGCSEDVVDSEATRWEVGRALRNCVVPAHLPAFADVLDYLALADVDAHLWNSLPFMLAFGYEQARALQPLLGLDVGRTEGAATACALFSTLLSVFDYVVDETEHSAAVFAIEPTGLDALFGNRAAKEDLRDAYHGSADLRVRFVCTLFGALAAAIDQFADERVVNAGTTELEVVTRQLFSAERTSTLGRAGSLDELRLLARASADKSVLPFVALLHIAALPTANRVPSAFAVAASTALGRAICLADDLADLLTDLHRGSPTPLVRVAIEKVVDGLGIIDDTVLLSVAAQGSAELLDALRPEAFTIGIAAPPSEVVSFARHSVARWLGLTDSTSTEGPC